MLKYKIPQIVTLIRFKTLLVMWFFTTSFWINPPKSLIYSKKEENHY